MDLLDNEYIDEQSGESLVVKQFNKIVVWQHIIAVLSMLASLPFWWELISYHYIGMYDFLMLFGMAILFSVSSIIVWWGTWRQKKLTIKLSVANTEGLIQLQGRLWQYITVAVLSMTLVVGYLMFDFAWREWERYHYEQNVNPPMFPEPVPQVDFTVPPVEEVDEEWIEEVVPEAEENDRNN